MVERPDKPRKGASAHEHVFDQSGHGFLYRLRNCGGGAMVGGIGAVVSLQPPTQTMLDIADRIKIWALAAAVGGTIDPMRVIESNFLTGTCLRPSNRSCTCCSPFSGRIWVRNWCAGCAGRTGMNEEAKQPKLTGFRRFMQFTAVFILGMVTGSIVYNVIYQTSYNLLWIQNKDLTIQLHQAEEDIRTLKNTTTVPPSSKRSRCAWRNAIRRSIRWR